MSKLKSKTQNEINEGIREYQQNKIMRRSSLTREQFENVNVRLTEKQNDLFKQIRNHILTIVHGPAGTSKTFTSCYTALWLMANKKIEKIIITKPIKESGEEIGLLPGTVLEKIDPYKQSYYTNFCKIIDKQTVDWMFATGEITFEPLAYMRGSTYDNCIMMLDECFTWETRVVTKHKKRGSFNYIRIKDIVDGFKNGKTIKVSSWNERKKIIEEKKIIGVFENGTKKIIDLKIKNRNRIIRTTPNHPFLTFEDGELVWKNISEVNKNIILYKENNTNNSTILCNDSYDIILGMILGDSSLLKNNQQKNSYRILTNHSVRQRDYMEFKKSIFNDISSYRNGLISGFTGEEQCGFQTKSINVSDEFYNACYNGKKFLSKNIERWFTVRSLALWYMDDGSYNRKSGRAIFSTYSFSENEVQILSSIVKSQFNIESSIYSTKKGYVLSLNRTNTNKLFELLRGYIIDSMSYKCNNLSSIDPNLYTISYNSNLTIGDIEYKKDGGEEMVYNIEVEENNNYFAENILVHNCQNASIKQLMLWSTRLGQNSKAVMMGDTSQYDVKKKDSGYVDFIDMTLGMPDLFTFEFHNEDIVRYKFLVELANRYDKYRAEKDI